MFIYVISNKWAKLCLKYTHTQSEIKQANATKLLYNKNTNLFIKKFSHNKFTVA